MKWLGIEVPEHRFVEALLASERLTEAEALDRKRLGAAVEQLVADFIKRWPPTDTARGTRPFQKRDASAHRRNHETARA